MTQDTEALKVDIAARALFDFDVETERRQGRKRNRKWETELPEYRDHMRAKASAMLAALSPTPDAGEVQAAGRDITAPSALTFADGLEAAAREAESWHGKGPVEQNGNAVWNVACDLVAAAIRKLGE